MSKSVLKTVLIALVLAVAGCSLFPTRTARMDVTRTATIVPQERFPALSVREAILIETSAGKRCNAVRIDGRTVATAAHCLDGASSVDVFEAGRINRTMRFVTNPGYAMADRETGAGADLAKITVVGPDDTTVAIRVILPGPVEIHVIDGSGRPRVVPCDYLGRAGALVELSCTVELGWSGAPILQNGALVGILSSRGEGDTRAIAQMADAARLDSF